MENLDSTFKSLIEKAVDEKIESLRINREFDKLIDDKVKEIPINELKLIVKNLLSDSEFHQIISNSVRIHINYVLRKMGDLKFNIPDEKEEINGQNN